MAPETEVPHSIAESPVPIASAVPGPVGAPPPAATPFRKLFQTLKDFKELLGIIVFLVGAVTVIVNYFATKAQVIELRCEMQRRIVIATSDTAGNLIDLEISDVKRRSKDLANLLKEASGAPREHLAEEFEDLNVRLQSLGTRRKEAEAESKTAHAALENHGCSEVPKTSAEMSP
jgi:hypothetical protein